VKGANRGDAALTLLREEPFDLMIVDYKMPEMNGFEVFEQARPIRPDMTFMLLTGHGSSDVIEDATEMGFDAILLKPFTREQLRESVEQILGARS
jgi:YesN/AraC family two-component response regulator